MKTLAQKSDLLVFSQQRWNCSFGRTEQIMTRYARYRRVYYFETPILGISQEVRYLIGQTRDDVKVITPYLPADLSVFEQKSALIELLQTLIHDEKIVEYSVWTDTPKAMPLVRALTPKALMYDCQRDFSVTNPELESELFLVADAVFVNGPTLYGSKRGLHTNIHHQPDSIDYRHFYQARLEHEDMEDLKSIPHPRIGFFGNLDGNIDYELIKQLAQLKPEWHFVLAGNIIVDPESLPHEENIHYLESKSYVRLPLYFANMDCTILPYKLNKETKFLSPSLLSQSLVAGCPVVSTSLEDVVHAFDTQKLVSVADSPLDLVEKIEKALETKADQNAWMELVDKNYRGMSWDQSSERLAELEHDIYTQQRVRRDRGFRSFVKQLLPETEMAHKIKGSILGRFYGSGSYWTREASYRK